MAARAFRRASVLIAIGCAAVVAALAPGASLSVSRPAAVPDLDAACAEGRPYFVTSCLPLGGDAATWPALVMFQDTPADSPHYQLASIAQLGSVYGLAYSHRDRALFAAAFRKRQLDFGPQGPGAIYRVELRIGRTTLFAEVPDAAAQRPVVVGADEAGKAQVGRMGLGDLDLSEDETELFVTNLFDRRVYRYDTATGTLLGSFATGGATLPWAKDARPFGLGVRQGRALHGVVNSAESTQDRAGLDAYVFSSLPDGSDLRQVAAFDLDYERGPVGNLVEVCPNCPASSADWRWQPWTQLIPMRRGEKSQLLLPMPWLSDLALLGDGRLAIGLRDRLGDVTAVEILAPPMSEWGTFYYVFAGDVLLGRPAPGGWDVATGPEFFADGVRNSAESALGGLAVAGPNHLVSMHHAVDRDRNVQPAAIWSETAGGQRTAAEKVCYVSARYSAPWSAGIAPAAWLRLAALPLARADNEGTSWFALGTVGDVETLCAPPDTRPSPTPPDPATPTAAPSATPTPSPRPTATATWTPTATAAPSPTLTHTPRSGPIYLPVLLRESCTPTQRRVDAVLVIDTSSSMLDRTSLGQTKLAAAADAARAFIAALHLDQGDQVALVAFNERAALVAPLTADPAALGAGLDGLTTDQFTRIDLGIALARQELTGPRHRGSHTAAMIVLTDGRANPVPVAAAVEQAHLAKEDGVQVFTVGLGLDLDTAALVAMASRPEWYYRAPDAADLAAIYPAIAQTIPCPPAGFWGGR